MDSGQKVVVVDGNTEVLHTLERVLEARRYDMVFVESREWAYSQIRKTQPDLVILCTPIDQPESLQLLTMLRMDVTTRHIPVVMSAIEETNHDLDEILSRMADEDEAAFASSPSLRMN